MSTTESQDLIDEIKSLADYMSQHKPEMFEDFEWNALIANQTKFLTLYHNDQEKMKGVFGNETKFIGFMELPKFEVVLTSKLLEEFKDKHDEHNKLDNNNPKSSEQKKTELCDMTGLRLNIVVPYELAPGFPLFWLEGFDHCLYRFNVFCEMFERWAMADITNGRISHDLELYFPSSYGTAKFDTLVETEELDFKFFPNLSFNPNHYDVISKYKKLFDIFSGEYLTNMCHHITANDYTFDMLCLALRWLSDGWIKHSNFTCNVLELMIDLYNRIVCVTQYDAETDDGYESDETIVEFSSDSRVELSEIFYSGPITPNFINILIHIFVETRDQYLILLANLHDPFVEIPDKTRRIKLRERFRRIDELEFSIGITFRPTNDVVVAELDISDISTFKIDSADCKLTGATSFEGFMLCLLVGSHDCDELADIVIDFDRNINRYIERDVNDDESSSNQNDSDLDLDLAAVECTNFGYKLWCTLIRLIYNYPGLCVLHSYAVKRTFRMVRAAMIAESNDVESIASNHELTAQIDIVRNHIHEVATKHIEVMCKGYLKNVFKFDYVFESRYDKVLDYIDGIVEGKYEHKKTDHIGYHV